MYFVRISFISFLWCKISVITQDGRRKAEMDVFTAVQGKEFSEKGDGMKEEKMVQDKIRLLEKEVMTVTERVEELAACLCEVDDLKTEIKALKLFICRLHPALKDEFPNIIKKVAKKG